MNTEQVVRHMSEHHIHLFLSHRCMRSEGRHDVSKSITIIVIDHFGNFTGI